MRWPYAIAILLVPTLAAADAKGELVRGNALAVIGAATDGDTVAVQATAGWDQARGELASGIALRGLIATHVSLVGGASVEGGGAWRPSAGARFSVRTEPADLAVTVQYKAQGFSEPEGELELVAVAGRTIGGAYVIAGGAYGQDLDARDRDGELAAGIAVPLGGVVAGASTRARYAFGAMTELGARWDAVLDAGVAIPFGRYAVRGAAGVVAIDAARVKVGPMGTVTVCAFF